MDIIPDPLTRCLYSPPLIVPWPMTSRYVFMSLNVMANDAVTLCRFCFFSTTAVTSVFIHYSWKHWSVEEYREYRYLIFYLWLLKLLFWAVNINVFNSKSDKLLSLFLLQLSILDFLIAIFGTIILATGILYLLCLTKCKSSNHMVHLFSFF